MDYFKSLLLLKMILSLLSYEMLIISLIIAKELLWWCVWLMIVLKTAMILVLLDLQGECTNSCVRMGSFVLVEVGGLGEGD